MTRDGILAAAIGLLEDGGGQGLTMRALATRLGVTPMCLYHHVDDRAGLLSALADRVYGAVLDEAGGTRDARAELRTLLTRYHDAVGRHPQLTLAMFAEPRALIGVTRRITARVTTLLAALTAEQALWRDVLIDHAHGSGLALAAARGDPAQREAMREQYLRSLDCLLARLSN